MNPLAEPTQIGEHTLARRRANSRRPRPDSPIGGIREALEEGRLLVYAQPIVDLQSGDAVHHELLIRLSTEDGRIVSAQRFLPLAEELSLLEQIDRWMLGHAAVLAGCGIPVAVNLSAQSLARTELIDDFRGELSRAGADPSLIVVELTVTALRASGRPAEQFVGGLRDLGSRVALDGFGAGLDFGYAQRLPADLLEIGREFVKGLPSSEACRLLVRAVVDLAHGAGQRTVAEGVEDQPTLRTLRELGVDYAQGYEIARPAPIHEVVGGGVSR